MSGNNLTIRVRLKTSGAAAVLRELTQTTITAEDVIKHFQYEFAMTLERILEKDRTFEWCFSYNHNLEVRFSTKEFYIIDNDDKVVSFEVKSDDIASVENPVPIEFYDSIREVRGGRRMSFKVQLKDGFLIFGGQTFNTADLSFRKEENTFYCTRDDGNHIFTWDERHCRVDHIMALWVDNFFKHQQYAVRSRHHYNTHYIHAEEGNDLIEYSVRRISFSGVSGGYNFKIKCGKKELFEIQISGVDFNCIYDNIGKSMAPVTPKELLDSGIRTKIKSMLFQSGSTKVAGGSLLALQTITDSFIAKFEITSIPNAYVEVEFGRYCPLIPLDQTVASKCKALGVFSMRIKSVSLWNLFNVDLGGKNDPFFRIDFYGLKVNSPHQLNRGDNATWTYGEIDKSSAIDIVFHVNPNVVGSGTFGLQVLDYNFTGETVIGSLVCAIPQDIRNDGRRDVTMEGLLTHNSKPRGNVRIIMCRDDDISLQDPVEELGNPMEEWDIHQNLGVEEIIVKCNALFPEHQTALEKNWLDVIKYRIRSLTRGRLDVSTVEFIDTSEGRNVSCKFGVANMSSLGPLLKQIRVVNTAFNFNAIGHNFFIQSTRVNRSLSLIDQLRNAMEINNSAPEGIESAAIALHHYINLKASNRSRTALPDDVVNKTVDDLKDLFEREFQLDARSVIAVKNLSHVEAGFGNSRWALEMLRNVRDLVRLLSKSLEASDIDLPDWVQDNFTASPTDDYLSVNIEHRLNSFLELFDSMIQKTRADLHMEAIINKKRCLHRLLLLLYHFEIINILQFPCTIDNIQTNFNKVKALIDRSIFKEDCLNLLDEMEVKISSSTPNFASLEMDAERLLSYIRPVDLINLKFALENGSEMTGGSVLIKASFLKMWSHRNGTLADFSVGEAEEAGHGASAELPDSGDSDFNDAWAEAIDDEAPDAAATADPPSRPTLQRMVSDRRIDLKSGSRIIVLGECDIPDCSLLKQVRQHVGKSAIPLDFKATEENVLENLLKSNQFTYDREVAANHRFETCIYSKLFKKQILGQLSIIDGLLRKSITYIQSPIWRHQDWNRRYMSFKLHELKIIASISPELERRSSAVRKIILSSLEQAANSWRRSLQCVLAKVDDQPNFTSSDFEVIYLQLSKLFEAHQIFKGEFDPVQHSEPTVFENSIRDILRFQDQQAHRATQVDFKTAMNDIVLKIYTLTKAMDCSEVARNIPEDLDTYLTSELYPELQCKLFNARQQVLEKLHLVLKSNKLDRKFMGSIQLWPSINDVIAEWTAIDSIFIQELPILQVSASEELLSSMLRCSNEALTQSKEIWGHVTAPLEVQRCFCQIEDALFRLNSSYKVVDAENHFVLELFVDRLKEVQVSIDAINSDLIQNCSKAEAHFENDASFVNGLVIIDGLTVLKTLSSECQSRIASIFGLAVESIRTESRDFRARFDSYISSVDKYLGKEEECRSVCTELHNLYLAVQKQYQAYSSVLRPDSDLQPVVGELAQLAKDLAQQVIGYLSSVTSEIVSTSSLTKDLNRFCLIWNRSLFVFVLAETFEIQVLEVAHALSTFTNHLKAEVESLLVEFEENEGAPNVEMAYQIGVILDLLNFHIFKNWVSSTGTLTKFVGQMEGSVSAKYKAYFSTLTRIIRENFVNMSIADTSIVARQAAANRVLSVLLDLKAYDQIHSSYCLKLNLFNLPVDRDNVSVMDQVLKALPTQTVSQAWEKGFQEYLGKLFEDAHPLSDLFVKFINSIFTTEIDRGEFVSLLLPSVARIVDGRREPTEQVFTVNQLTTARQTLQSFLVVSPFFESWFSAGGLKIQIPITYFSDTLKFEAKKLTNELHATVQELCATNDFQQLASKLDAPFRDIVLYAARIDSSTAIEINGVMTQVLTIHSGDQVCSNVIACLTTDMVQKGWTSDMQMSTAVEESFKIRASKYCDSFSFFRKDIVDKVALLRSDVEMLDLNFSTFSSKGDFLMDVFDKIFHLRNASKTCQAYFGPVSIDVNLQNATEILTHKIFSLTAVIGKLCENFNLMDATSVKLFVNKLANDAGQKDASNEMFMQIQENLKMWQHRIVLQGRSVVDSFITALKLAVQVARGESTEYDSVASFNQKIAMISQPFSLYQDSGIFDILNLPILLADELSHEAILPVLETLTHDCLSAIPLRLGEGGSLTVSRASKISQAIFQVLNRLPGSFNTPRLTDSYKLTMDAISKESDRVNSLKTTIWSGLSQISSYLTGSGSPGLAKATGSLLEHWDEWNKVLQFPDRLLITSNNDTDRSTSIKARIVLKSISEMYSKVCNDIEGIIPGSNFPQALSILSMHKDCIIELFELNSKPDLVKAFEMNLSHAIPEDKSDIKGEDRDEWEDDHVPAEISGRASDAGPTSSAPVGKVLSLSYTQNITRHRVTNVFSLLRESFDHSLESLIAVNFRCKKEDILPEISNVGFVLSLSCHQCDLFDAVRPLFDLDLKNSYPQILQAFRESVGHFLCYNAQDHLTRSMTLTDEERNREMLKLYRNWQFLRTVQKWDVSRVCTDFEHLKEELVGLERSIKGFARVQFLSMEDCINQEFCQPASTPLFLKPVSNALQQATSVYKKFTVMANTLESILFVFDDGDDESGSRDVGEAESKDDGSAAVARSSSTYSIPDALKVFISDKKSLELFLSTVTKKVIQTLESTVELPTIIDIIARCMLELRYLYFLFPGGSSYLAPIQRAQIELIDIISNTEKISRKILMRELYGYITVERDPPLREGGVEFASDTDGPFASFANIRNNRLFSRRTPKELFNKLSFDMIVCDEQQRLLKVQQYELRYNKFTEDWTANVKEGKKNLIQTRTSIVNQAFDQANAVDVDPYERVCNLITLIFSSWTLLYSGLIEAGTDLSAPDIDLEDKTPHAGQVVSLLALFDGITITHSPDESVVVKVPNQFIQIGTGEGKSVTLSIASLIFSLLGVDVDCVCYSGNLSRRDYTEFEMLFKEFKMESHIKYDTFDVKCLTFIDENAGPGGVDGAVRSLLTGSEVTRVGPGGDIRRNRIIFMDEVDMFFADSLCGELFKTTTKIEHHSISKLILFMWRERDNSEYKTFEQIADTEVFIECKSCFAFERWVDILTAAVKTIVFDRDSTCRRHYKAEDLKIKYLLDGSDQYTDGNVCYRYETVFHFLKEFEPCLTETELLGHTEYLCLQISSGQFSYSEIPIKYLDKGCVIGVSGTLHTLTPVQREFIRTSYNVGKFTLIPSAFGERDDLGTAPASFSAASTPLDLPTSPASAAATAAPGPPAADEAMTSVVFVSDVEEPVVASPTKVFTFLTGVMVTYGSRFVATDPTNHVRPGIQIVTEAEHHQALTEEIIARLRDSEDRHRAILIFFANEEAIDEYIKSNGIDQICERGDISKRENIKFMRPDSSGLNSDENRKYLIRHACQPKSVTFCTREFGRGVNFVVYHPELIKSGGVHVIQAFVSLEKSEEVQVRGRTGRQDNPGSYSLVLNQEDVIETINWTDVALTDISDKELYQLMDAKRIAHYDVQYQKRLSKVLDECSKIHNASQAFIDSILRRDIEHITAFLLEENKPPERKVIQLNISRTAVLLDATQSMGLMLELCKGSMKLILRVIEEVLISKGFQSQFQLRFYVYRNYNSGPDKLVEESPAWVSSADDVDFQNFLQKIKVDGGRGREAIEAALQLVNAEIENGVQITQIVCIGDAGPNEFNDIVKHRKDSEKKWKWGTSRFKDLTTFEAQFKIIKDLGIPFHTFFVKPFGLRPPEKVASDEKHRLKLEELSLCTGGTAQVLDLRPADQRLAPASTGDNETRGYAQLLAEAILKDIGGAARGEELVEALRAKAAFAR